VIAVYGRPGSVHHRWQRVKTKAEAAEFFDSCRAHTERVNPAAIGQHTQVLTNAEAADMKYADGRRVYNLRADAGWETRDFYIERTTRK